MQDGWSYLYEATAEAVATSKVSLTSRVDPGPSTRCRTPRRVFGASLHLAAGRACWIDTLGWAPKGLLAHFSFGDPAAPVWHGEARIATWPADDPDDVEQARGSIDSSGWVYFPVSEQRLEMLSDGVEVLGVVVRTGDVSFAECVSDVTRVWPV